MAINDKSVPMAIKRLKWTANFVLLSLLAVAIVEFTIVRSQFRDINDNFNLVVLANKRNTELQKLVYNVRALSFISQKKLINY